MNKLYLYTLIALSFITLSSCNHNDPNDDKFENDPEAGFVYFSRISTSIPYSQTSTIPVELTAPVNSDGLDITYNVVESEDSSTAPSQILGTFTQENAIPAGETTGFLSINLAEVTEGNCYLIDVEIVDVSNNSVEIGLDQNGEDGAVYPTEHYLSIGAFPESFIGTSYFQGNPVINFQPTLTPVEGEENVYLIDTAWGSALLPTLNPSLDALPYAGILTINADGTVVIEGNQSYATGGEGIYNACDQTISYTLTQAYLSDSTITFDVVLNPAQ